MQPVLELANSLPREVRLQISWVLQETWSVYTRDTFYSGGSIEEVYIVIAVPEVLMSGVAKKIKD